MNASEYTSVAPDGRVRFALLDAPKMRHSSAVEEKWVEARLMALAGASPKEISQATGKTISAVYAWAWRERLDIVGKTKQRRAPAHDARAEKMTEMFRGGATYQQVGEAFNVSRERVRQVLKRAGLTGKDGGMASKAPIRAAKVAAKKERSEALNLSKWGLTYAEKKEMRANGVLAAFINQKNSARARGIEWGLSFVEWYEIWLSSGFLELRGKGKDFYCMSRLEDSGGYTVGNVEIKTNSENSKEAVKQWVGKHKPATGVFCLYPGTPRPFIARYGRKQIGRFATEQEGTEARKEYMTKHGIKEKQK